MICYYLPEYDLDMEGLLTRCLGLLPRLMWSVGSARYLDTISFARDCESIEGQETSEGFTPFTCAMLKVYIYIPRCLSFALSLGIHCWSESR